jgi:hypothetical protein
MVNGAFIIVILEILQLQIFSFSMMIQTGKFVQNSQNVSQRTFQKQNKWKISCTTEVGHTFFGLRSVDKYEKLSIGPDSVQNF